MLSRLTFSRGLESACYVGTNCGNSSQNFFNIYSFKQDIWPVICRLVVWILPWNISSCSAVHQIGLLPSCYHDSLFLVGLNQPVMSAPTVKIEAKSLSTFNHFIKTFGLIWASVGYWFEACLGIYLDFQQSTKGVFFLSAIMTHFFSWAWISLLCRYWLWKLKPKSYQNLFISSRHLALFKHQ